MAQREDEFIAVMAHSPRLPQVVDKLTSLLAEEAARREAFYAQITENDKAEFINGEVIFHSPVKYRHNGVVRRLLILMDTYVQGQGLGSVGVEKLLISLTRNDYEPDLCFFGADKAATLDPDQMRFPAPDLVVEVLSKSTEANDRGVKFDDYAAHGVAEYWIIDPAAETVEQYRLDGESYTLAIKAKSGDLESAVIDGFTIPVRALFDDAEQRATLARLLATTQPD
jgi:Uma2 family endonuclease